MSFFVSIPNGPSVNIASREITSPEIDKPFKLDKSHSLVRGFDITSAFLQQEIIKIEAKANCKNIVFSALLVLTYNLNVFGVALGTLFASYITLIIFTSFTYSFIIKKFKIL